MNNTKRFYIISLVVLVVLSAYPLINGVRMLFFSVRNGAITPEQYAKYVVPYTAICVSVIWFAALQPLFMRLRRFALPIGLATAYGVFYAIERIFETMQIHVSGMSLIDAATLAPQAAGTTAATVDIWQAALCVASPVMMDQSLSYAYQDKLVYVMADGLYKIHYYLISLILISMVCGLVYGIAKMLRDGARSQMKSIFLRGVSAAALLALCVFANTTAFFRRPTWIQTPTASVLTCLFFIILGASVGVYAGSFLLKKSKIPGVGVPALISICATVLMYTGEALMMRGNIYRFGRGWFFYGLPIVVLAPVDILIILFAGALALLTLCAARKYENWPGKRTVVATIAICLAIASIGPTIAMATPKNTAPEYTDSAIQGCYVFDANLYTNPLSSFMAFGNMPEVYGFDEDVFYIANTGNGSVRRFYIEYYNTPVSADEFSLNSESLAISFGWLPSIAQYSERYLLAVVYSYGAPAYGVYQMDGDIWLVGLSKSGIWTIYRIRKTETTTISDIERAYALHEGEIPEAHWPAGYENQITLTDVYALTRKGTTLTLDDFEPFFYTLTGEYFTIRRYDVVGADTIYVTIAPDGSLATAELLSRRTWDVSQTFDLRGGFQAFAEYMSPLHSFHDIELEYALSSNEPEYEMFFEDDYFGSECRYYLSAARADSFIVTHLYNGERMSIRAALAERRVTVEMLAANGLDNIRMIPINNPLGGEFKVLHHLHVFTLNGEEFYPSKSFMYVAQNNGSFQVYYNTDELAQIFEWYGYPFEVERLRQFVNPDNSVAIARGNYILDTVLAEAGVTSEVGWALSSHTPVRFSA